MTSAQTSSTSVNRHTIFVLVGLVFLSLVLGQVPIFQLLVAPINTFVVGVHEMGHALAAILTGGQVTGMTVVPDGQGHGGLTFSRGGFRFLVAQAGYLGTTLFGAFLILISRYRKLSKAVLVSIGGIMIFASIFFMAPTIVTEWRILEGLLSLVSGLAIGALFVFAGLKMNDHMANLFVLFLAAQTGLNAMSSVWTVVNVSATGGGSSDASSMQDMTGIPAIVWALTWTGLSLYILWWALVTTYKADWKAPAAKLPDSSF